MKTIFIIIISFFVISASGQDYKDLIKNVSGIEKYPDASAINVFTKIDINVNKDESYTKHVFYIKKILTYKGKRNYSDVKLDYNNKFETIELGECFSIRDGKKITIPIEAIHDNGTYLTMYSPEYIDQRQKVINFPAIEPNDFIVVEYTITSKANNYFSGVEQMQEDNPYLKKKLSITCPAKSFKIYSETVDGVAEKTVTNGDKTTIIWSVENMPALKDEKNRPPLSIIGKPVFYSSVETWKQASNIYFNQFESVNYNTKEVAKLANSITDLNMGDNKKMQKIYAYIQDNFEFKYSLIDDGFKPQEASMVLNQKFGSVKELTALFCAMAKAVKITANPVLLISNTNVPQYKRITSSSAISQLYVYYDGKLMGFNSQYQPYGSTWFEKAFLVSKEGEFTTFIQKSDYKTNRTINVKLNNDFTADVSFMKILKAKDDYKLRRRFKNQTEKKRKIWFSSNISDKSISVIGEPVFKNIDDYAKNLEISFNAKINNYYKMQDNYFYLKLPEAEGIALELTGNDRENDYEIWSAISFTEKYIFDNVPSGFYVIKPKTSIIKTYKDDKVEMSFEIKSEIIDGKVIIYRKLMIPKTIIASSDYERFAAFISEVQKPLNNMIFLSK